MEIGELFRSESRSLHEFFNGKPGIGYEVPLYQRPYSWDAKQHIQRLFNDILETIGSLKHDNEALKFIGAMIFVREKSMEHPFYGIIDGQQRLITLVLTAASLHRILEEDILPQIKSEGDSAICKHLKKLIERISRDLYVCFAKNKTELPRDSSDLYPVIIRNQADNWSRDPKDTEYRSPIADYLNKYIRHFFLNLGSNFSWESSQHKNKSHESFERNRRYINDWLSSEELKNTESDRQVFGDIKSNILNTKIGELLLPGIDIKDMMKCYQESAVDRKPIYDRAISLLCFSHFMLHKVVITEVVAKKEEYGFEIFEALNTTGEPLTAIETFRPAVMRCEEKLLKDMGGYEKSPSKHIFESIDEYLDELTEASKSQDKSKIRESESKQLVITFALFTRGERISKHLASQRRNLCGWYSKYKNDPDKGQEFVRRLGEVSEFRRCFWHRGSVGEQLPNMPSRRETLFYVEFLRSMKHTLAIPILLRYYSDYKKSGDENDFLRACRATAIFVAMWRAYTGGTGGIDLKFRKIMEGGDINGSQSKGLKLGKDLSNPILAIEELKRLYRILLKKKIESKKLWMETASSQPLYSASGDLCRFILLVAAHSAYLEGEKLVKGKESAGTNYQQYEQYIDEKHSTIEHIAPQKLTGDWAGEFKAENSFDIRNTIGNLTLLPQPENSKAGNKSWEVKRLFFQACSAETPSQVEEIMEKAHKKGIQFKKETKRILRENEQIPMAKHISTFDKWDQTTIEERSRNILELAWIEFEKGLGLGEDDLDFS